MKFRSNFLGYVDYLKSEGWKAIDLNDNTAGLQVRGENWVIYDPSGIERARSWTEDDAWEAAIDSERIGSMDVGKLGDVNPEDRPILRLKERVIELLQRQVEAAFDSDAFYSKSGEYVVIDLTLRADTNDEIRRSFNVTIEIHD